MHLTVEVLSLSHDISSAMHKGSANPDCSRRDQRRQPLYELFLLTFYLQPRVLPRKPRLKTCSDCLKWYGVWEDPSGSSLDKRAMVEGRPSVFCSLTFLLATELTNPIADDSNLLQVSGSVFPGFHKWLSCSPDLIGFRHQTGVMEAPSPALWTEQLLVPSLSSVRQLLLLF